MLFTETDPEVVKSTNQYVTIENLRKYTNYTVWVLAYTKVGDGMKTKPFYCRTHEDGKWQRRRWFNERKRRHGTPREGHGGTARPLPPEPRLQFHAALFIYLRASFYPIAIAFYLYLILVVVPVVVAVPSAPQAIKAIPASSTKIIISWLPPDLPNGDIVSSSSSDDGNGDGVN